MLFKADRKRLVNIAFTEIEKQSTVSLKLQYGAGFCYLAQRKINEECGVGCGFLGFVFCKLVWVAASPRKMRE